MADGVLQDPGRQPVMADAARLAGGSPRTVCRVVGGAMPGTTGDGPSAQEIEVEAAARHLGLTAVASAPPSTEGFALAVGRRASVPEPPARDWSARPAGGHGP